MTYDQYKVFVSEQAIRMLKLNIAFIAEVNVEASSKLKKAIMDGIRSLEYMPKRYPFFNEEYMLPNKYRKMVINKYYFVLYQIQDDVVNVDYILDNMKWRGGNKKSNSP